MKKPEKNTLEHLVIAYDPLARLTYELASQLQSHLPISSFEKLEEKLSEIVLDGYRLQLKMFAPHVSSSLFPITTVEDLVRKLSEGVRHAVTMTRSASAPIRHGALGEIIATVRNGDPTGRPGIPVAFIPASPLVSGSMGGKENKS